MDLPRSPWPGCEPACHGCRHRALDYAASLAQKQAYLARALAPWADRLAPVQGVAGTDRLGYRDRVTLNVRWSADVGWRFGLMQRDELIAIHDCPVHSARVRRLIAVLRESLPRGEDFALAFLHVSGAQAVLIAKQRTVDAGRLAGCCARLSETGIEGLWLHLHPSAGRRLFGRGGWQLLAGSPESQDRAGLAHGPTAFMQPLPAQHAAALARAQTHLAPEAGVAVLDLYCGHGSSLVRWCAAGAATLGIDLSGEALQFAARNAPAAQLLRGSCATRLPQAVDWWARQAAVRVCYANPPRSGLEAAVLDALARQLAPRRLAYLSCSAGTLARDLAVLESHGHTIAALIPYDFFPQTHHVEVLALASRP